MPLHVGVIESHVPLQLADIDADGQDEVLVHTVGHNIEMLQVLCWDDGSPVFRELVVLP
jgi:hypothetical protein